MSNKNGRYLQDGTLNIAGRWKSPGPGKYSLPSCTGSINHDATLEKRPAYTMANRYKETMADRSPGPIYLLASDVTVTGRVKTPVCHIAGRPKEYNLWISPGPGEYCPEKYKHSSPAYRIGEKHKHLDKPVIQVGPNQYVLPNTIGKSNFTTNIKTAPRFSISSRNKFMSYTNIGDDSPSKLYNPSLDSIKTRSPKWTISGRNYLPELDKNGPGPNKYKAEDVKLNFPSSRAVSMGIRHSEFCTTGLPIHFEPFNC